MKSSKKKPSKRTLSYEKEAELATRMLAGDTDARNKLIEANEWVVTFLVRKFRRSNIPVEDLHQEARLAMLAACETYEPSKGHFPHWAGLYIRKSLLMLVVKQGSHIAIARHAHIIAGKLSEVEALLRGELGRDPYDAEVRERLGWSARTLKRARQAEKCRKVPMQIDLSEREVAMNGNYDMQLMTRDRRSVTIDDGLVDNSDPSIIAEDRESLQLVRKALYALPQEDRDMLLRHLDGESSPVIGKYFGLEPSVVLARIKSIIKRVKDQVVKD